MIYGVALIKDEADIIERTISHMLGQVDRVIVADNRSTDGTRQILDRMDVEVVDDPVLGHWQSRKITTLAERARAEGATWVVPFDADELWFARLGRVGDVLEAIPPAAQLVEAVIFDHVPTADARGGDPVERMGWRRAQQEPLHKVACRPQDGLTVHQGNHCADYGTPFPLWVRDQLVIRHFPYRSPEQFISKARNGSAAYAATDLPEDMGAHKRLYGRLLEEGGEQALRAYYAERFYVEDPENAPSLTYDPV